MTFIGEGHSIFFCGYPWPVTRACNTAGRVWRSMLRHYKSGPRDWTGEALLGACQVAVIDVGGVFEADLASFVEFGEDFLQSLHHGRVGWGVGRGDERAAAQAACYAFEIEFLEIWRGARAVRIHEEEIAHVLLAGIAFFDRGVVCAVFAKQRFVGAQKGSGVGEAFIPDNDDPAVRFEDASKFGAAEVWIEPMEGLAGGD